MKLEMEIEQSDNGWILRFTGHDCLAQIIICKDWGEVLNELESHFGWWLDAQWVKKP